MALYEFEGKRPKIAASAYVHPEAVLIGGVTLGEQCYVGAGAVLRADWGDIEIGDGSNVQENCVIHVRPGDMVRLGPASHVGHGAIIHGAGLGQHVLVGMGAILHDDVFVGDGSVIGAGCVVLEGAKIPPNSLVVGVPGKVIGQVSEKQAELMWWGTRLYQALPQRCHEGLRRID